MNVGYFFLFQTTSKNERSYYSFVEKVSTGSLQYYKSIILSHTRNLTAKLLYIMERRSTISFIQSYYECRNEIQTFMKIPNVRKRKESLWEKYSSYTGTHRDRERIRLTDFLHMMTSFSISRHYYSFDLESIIFNYHT